jgi:hypothetical protein
MSEISELLERFRRGAELVAAVTTGASNVELDFVPPAGGWSVRQIVCHVGDAEMVCAARLRAILAEEGPHMLAFDQDAWAANLNYKSRRISEALDLFRTVRAANYELLRTLPEEAYGRKGTHNERGEMTLLDVVRMLAEHAEGHAKQILGVREKYRESRKSA